MSGPLSTMRIWLLGIAALVSWGLPGTAEAHPTFYPHGTEVIRYPSVSNKVMNCDWNFVCEWNVPLFHMHSPDQLHRLVGWARTGSWANRQGNISFVVYASTYDGSSDGASYASIAWNDLQAAAHFGGYDRVGGGHDVLPSDMKGSGVVEERTSDTGRVVLMAAYSGNLEVEGVVVMTHVTPTMRIKMRQDLLNQMQAAFGADGP